MAPSPHPLLLNALPLVLWVAAWMIFHRRANGGCSQCTITWIENIPQRSSHRVLFCVAGCSSHTTPYLFQLRVVAVSVEAHDGC